MGRPSVAWGDEQRETFRRLCAIMCTRDEACSVMRVSPKTLARLIAENFPDTPTWEDAFAAFSGDGRASLRRAQFDAALSGDKALLIWLGKQYLGQREPSAKEAQPRPAQTGERAQLVDFKRRVPSLRASGG